jgi:hypothetical protein
MMTIGCVGRGVTNLVGILLLLSLLPGCGSKAANLALGVGSVVVAPAALKGAKVPTDEIAQTYYLGVYDPQGQLPPSIYRVRVQGQSSFLNRTKFASGWVHASLIDSLGTEIALNEKNGGLKIQKVNSDNQGQIATGRRLIMFGPEGFRKAPKDHRLVVVMGADPSAFFEAVDQTLRHNSLQKPPSPESRVPCFATFWRLASKPLGNTRRLSRMSVISRRINRRMTAVHANYTGQSG